MTKIDAGTIYGFAAVSLLTGAVVCTQPTELEEIAMRARDIMRMLGDGYEFVSGHHSYMPAFPVEKWPFDTDHEKMGVAACEFSNEFKAENKDDEVDVQALIELLKDEEIEKKYRLSKVKDNVMREVLLPF